MRLLSIPLFTLFIVTNGLAQDKNFAILSAEEIEMKDCAFDPGASAVVLLDRATSTYDNGYALISDYHIRIKVLKQDGIKYADVAVKYYGHDQFEFLSDVEATTINIDDKGKQAGLQGR